MKITAHVSATDYAAELYFESLGPRDTATKLLFYHFKVRSRLCVDSVVVVFGLRLNTMLFKCVGPSL